MDSKCKGTFEIIQQSETKRFNNKSERSDVKTFWKQYLFCTTGVVSDNNNYTQRSL